MHMVLIADVYLVNCVSEHPLLVELSSEDRIEVLGKSLAVTGQVLARVVPEQEQLPLVRLTGNMALEPIRVPALLLAHLAIPPQLLETFRPHVVRDPFWSSEFGLSLPHPVQQLL